MDSQIIVSDRGPVGFAATPQGLAPTRRPGSVTAILDAAARASRQPTAWFAPSSSPQDLLALRAGEFGRLQPELGYHFEAVPISEREFTGYYDDVGVRMLWLALHGLWPELTAPPSDPAALAAFTDGYQEVNRRVAARVARHATPNALVFCHDYQLATTPGFVRRLLPAARVMHFTHTPFMTPADVERMPPTVAAAILTGMLGADLLGFQATRWAENFLDCCEQAGYRVRRDGGPGDGVVELTGERNRRVWVRRYPAPVDPAAVATAARHPKVREWEQRLLAGRPRRRVVKVERTDPAKNILRGLEAFERLLNRRADLRADAQMLLCLIPSRERVEEYRAYLAGVHAAVERINTRHPRSVTCLAADDPHRGLAALRHYDVLLVNAVRDGMNLVSLEGPLLNEGNGVLVLSTGAGASERLSGGALMVRDPRDVDETSRALERALDMPASERRARMTRLRAAIATDSPAAWLARQRRDLRRLTGGAADDGAEGAAGDGQPTSAAGGAWAADAGS